MNKKIFWAILILAFILRFYKLGQVPLSLDWDENSNAYNAYSILKTGRDEYGTFLPITNQSFDDYKPPLYMYLNVVTVVIFGLTPFAARFPSALFGFLTVPAIYFLAKKLFEKSDVSGQLSVVRSEPIALLAMLMLAISPWHIQFSRVGFEATVGLFTAVVAISFLLYALFPKQEDGNFKKSLLWITSGVFFGISLYSYHAERVFLPLLFLTFVIIWRREIFSINKKNLAVFVFTCILFTLPLIIFLPKEAISQRFKTTTQDYIVENLDRSVKFIVQDQKEGLGFGKYIHNRRLVIAQGLFSNYLAHFDLNFLFTTGDDNPRHHIEGMGMLYLFELPLIIYGIYQLIKLKNKQSIFLLSWFLISPVASSPTNVSPHAVRSLTMVIAAEIISAYALIKIYQIFKYKRIFLIASALVIISSLLIYLHNYYSHYKYDFASFWQYGYSQAVIESEKVKNQYEKINVDSSLEQAYIFWLFNTKYDPTSYQQLGSRNHFDKYYFNAQVPASPKELYISDAGKFPSGFEVVKTIYYPNGQEAIKIGYPK